MNNNYMKNITHIQNNLCKTIKVYIFEICFLVKVEIKGYFIVNIHIQILENHIFVQLNVFTMFVSYFI